MRNVLLLIFAAGLAGTSAQANDWGNQTTATRTGAFVGARLSIGAATNGRPTAALTVAPTQGRVTTNGMMRARIGQGLALNLKGGAKPTVTIAGMRADYALSLNSRGNVDARRKLGVSNGVWIGVGVGVVLVGAAVLLLDDYCDRTISSVCGDEE